jgi:hypothetical protein
MILNAIVRIEGAQQCHLSLVTGTTSANRIVAPIYSNLVLFVESLYNVP